MRSFRSKVGRIVIFIAVSTPLLLWFLIKPLELRLESGFMVLTSIGQLAGLMGMVLFSVTLLLSARLHFLEDYFGGLDRMYNLHHKLGTVAFLFLIVHPLILAFRYIPLSLLDTAQFLLPSADWPKNFGILALLLLMLILSVTFLTRWRYQILKFIHQILGFAFFFGSLHALFIPSDISNSPVLKVYMLLLITAGLSAYAYRTLFGSAVVKRYTYVVKAVNQLDPTVTEIVMAPEEKRMHYIPGQFIFISFVDGGVESEVHQISISSAPMEPVLRITVKALGDYTRTLRNLQVESVAKIEGPFGSFTYLNGKSIEQVWIAGGIGITPFLNMARNLRVNMHTGHKIDFYYSTRTKEEMIFLRELEAISAAYPNLRIVPFNADERGFLSMDVVQKLTGELKAKDIYVCGPPPMMQSLISQCYGMGIARARVHSEQFKLL